MSNNTLTGIEIFDEGVHNGLTFTKEDLDGLVNSFNALGLAGRLPLKWGHRGADARTDDTQPALGWIRRLYRKGTKLLADFSDVAPEVFAKVKSGAFRFCSIELLRNVRAGTRVIPWVVDACALLGATPPALGHLAPLKATRLPLEFEDLVSFNRQENDDDMSKEALETLTRKHVALLFETAIKDGRALPRDREMFNRRFPDASAEDAESFIAQTPRPPKSGPVSLSTGHTTVVPGSGRADHRALEAAQRLVLERKQAGDPLPGEPWQQLLAAAKLTFARDASLAEDWKTYPGES